MKRASRPKLTYVPESPVLDGGGPELPVPSLAQPSVTLRAVLLAGAAGLLPMVARAQSPVASSFATKDGRATTVIMACPTTNSTYFAEFCGVAGYPLHVTVDSGTVTVNGSSSGGSTPTTIPGTASAQLVGVQGGGSGALPVGISATSLPLPAGASTSALQSQIDANDAGSWVHVRNLPATQPVSGSVSVSNLPATQPVSGSVSVSNFPSTQAVSAAALPLPAGAATAALQPAINADGGALHHVTNFPAVQAVSGTVGVSSLPALPSGSNAIGSVSVSNFPSTQAVSAASLPLPTGAATASGVAGEVTALGSPLQAGGTVTVSSLPALPAGSNTIGSVTVSTVPQAARSGAWTDASVTATSTATVPSGLSAVASRVGLHLWNVGTSTVCMNYTATAAISGSGCAAGSVPIPAGSAYLEDQPGNVSPEAISLICTGASCPLTIKVR